MSPTTETPEGENENSKGDRLADLAAKRRVDHEQRERELDAARAARARESAEALAEGAEAAARVVQRSNNPLASIIVAVVTLLTGGGVAFGGWTASSALTAQVEVLTKKLDAMANELTETRKTIEAIKQAEHAAAARMGAERHEERIRDLERIGNDRGLQIERLKMEFEAIRRELREAREKK
jgi:predicted NBD/HSP70 family sugar kinase